MNHLPSATTPAPARAGLREVPAVVFFVIGGAGVFLGGIVMSRLTYGRGRSGSLLIVKALQTSS